MLYRVHVVVVLAIGSRSPDGSVAAPIDHWADTVSYWFGVNAEDAGAAVAQVERAAEHARGRDGDYIGGVILELQVRSAAAVEFKGYEQYLIRPITDPGIFYVTGTTHSGLPSGMIPAVRDRLAELRESIRQRGLPPASFVHPKPPDGKPPRRTRIVCPGCQSWAEFDSAGVICSLYDGLDPGSREAQIGRQTGAMLGRFVEEHLPCLKTSTHIALVFLHEGDLGYEALDPDRAV